MQPLIQTMIYHMESTISNGGSNFLNLTTNSRSNDSRRNTFISILTIFKASLDLLNDNTSEMYIREYFYMFKRSNSEDFNPKRMYLTDKKVYIHVRAATDLLQRPRVTRGFRTNIKAYFHGDIEIEWINIDGTRQRMAACSTTAHDKGHPIFDFFVRAAFGMIPQIRIRQYGRANKKLVMIEDAGKIKL